MELTIGQLAAIMKLAYMMAEADGQVSYEEVFDIKLQESFEGLDKDTANNVEYIAAEMEPIAACVTVAAIHDQDTKASVAAFLGSLMVSDGDIDESEIAVWRTISTICDLPAMDLEDALTIQEGDVEPEE